MPIGRRKALVIPPAVEDAPPSVIASAARIDVAAAQWVGFRYTDEAWQREAWGFYNCNGELSYVGDYIGAAMSLVRLYVRHVDENGVPQDEVVDEPDVAAIAATVLGGPAKSGAIKKAIAIGLTVAGACYLIGRAARPGIGDQWTVVATQFVRVNGGIVNVDFGNGHWDTLNPRRDVILKIWNQSPERPLLAQAPTRALLPTFALLQKLRMFFQAELNSRIASGGGLYPLPQELEYPGDADAGIPPGAPGVAQQVYESQASNIEGHGTAAAIGPTFFGAPIEVIAQMLPGPIRFDIPLSEFAPERYKICIDSISRGMNVPSDVIEGAQQQNHWSAWWSTEEFTTKTIAPLANLICDALNVYLAGKLIAIGKDPARYTMWYDLAPLHNSADKFTDTLNLYREGACNLETLLKSANYTLANAPDQKEFLVRQMWEVIKRDPTQLQSEGLRNWLGLDIPDYVPALEEIGPPPPPAPEQSPEARQVGSKPEQAAELTDDLQASLVKESPLLPAAHAVVLAALAVTGRRLKTQRNEFRGMFKDTDPTIMHTKVQVASIQAAGELLDSAALATARSSFEGLGVDPEEAVALVRQYTSGLLASGIPHSRELLRGFLKAAAK
jgi:hypothetical protein